MQFTRIYDLIFATSCSVRINAGVLPKSLQMLNLSKNNMAVIEGLRDLTRLRVLDLSFNRISRIGHGMGVYQLVSNLIFFLKSLISIYTFS